MRHSSRGPVPAHAPHPLTEKQLGEHTEWLRRLARAFVREDGAVDDLVQETWLVALRTPPAATSPLRAWLSGVLRNLVFKRRRGDARRDRRERVAAAEPAAEVQTPERLFDDCEAQERVALLL